MYTMTLEINQRCNLRCKYCYLGEKDGSKMTYEIACKAIDNAFKHTAIHKDRTLWIDFVGGEPLLDFDMIHSLVEYVNRKNEETDYKLLFSFTTNATIFNPEILDFLLENNFSVKVSIDGDQNVNDANRIDRTGKGSYERILSNLHYFKDFERKSGRYVQVTNVITGNNYEKYFDTLVYLTKELDFKIIDTAIDVGYHWTDQEIDVIAENIRKSFDYFIEAASENHGFRWEFADKVVNFEKERKKFYSCGAGIVSAYIRTDGGIYACPGNLDPSVQLGTVQDGLNKQKIYQLKHFEKINNSQCQSCEISKYCTEQSCIMQNLAVMGDINTPIPIMCRLRKLAYELYINNQNVIKRIVM